MADESVGSWTFLSNHAHVLICLARDAELRMREVAMQVGITERAVQSIVRDLVDGGYLKVTKIGRRNRYQISGSKRLRHPVEGRSTVADLIALTQHEP